MSENLNHLSMDNLNQDSSSWGESYSSASEYERSPAVRLDISCGLSDKSEKWLDITLQATVEGSEGGAIWKHKVDENAFLHAGKIRGHTPIPSGASRKVREIIQEANKQAENNADTYMRSLLNGSLSKIDDPALKDGIVEQALEASQSMYDALNAANNSTGSDS